MVLRHVRRHATGLLPASIVVCVAVFYIYAAWQVPSAAKAADEIVQKCGPTTSADGVGGLLKRITKAAPAGDMLSVLSALADTASDWVPILAAVLLIINHWPQRSR
eukprot:Skav213435  [mRNA]  locus=scaffold2160:55072:56825:+ [translate_table: standard]